MMKGSEEEEYHFVLATFLSLRIFKLKMGLWSVKGLNFAVTILANASVENTISCN